MVHLCTCTGGSTSTIKSSKRRSGTQSCKNCGGKPAIDGKKSSNCLLNTLTSLIHSDFKVSKGCRSSSRRPRRSNTIHSLDSEELLTKDSKGLEMPVSESEKLGVSVLECHFSEKAEHIPIKKRRFLFRASSPPCNNPNPPLEAAESGPKASSYGLQLNQNANCLPVSSETVTESNKNDKIDVKKLVKDDDFSGISILAAAACSNSLGAETDPKTVEKNVKIEVLESKLNNSSLASGISSTNQEPSNQKDVRFSWDLNTVMDAWEEPFVSDAAEEKSTFVEEKKTDGVGEFDSCQQNMGVRKEALDDVITVTKTLTVENTTRDLFSKWAKLNDSSETVDTKLSMDCSAPPGFDHCLNLPDKQDSSLATANFLENGPREKTVTSEKVENESMMKMELIANLVENKDTMIKEETQTIFVGPTSMVVEEEEEEKEKEKEKEKVAELQLENGFGYNHDNSEVEIGFDKQDEQLSVGYDSQYEDGELRESSWKEYELNNEENEYDLSNHNENDDFNPDFVDANETNEEENPSGVIKVTETESTKEADLNEKIQTSAEVLSGSASGQETSGKQQEIVANAYEWKMNVSGWDVLPENQKISSIKTRNNFTPRKFSYKDGEDVEGSRFYKKESQSRPSTHDMFLNRSRIRMQGCSSKGGDGLSSRPQRESGGIRSFGRGRYSPPQRRLGGMWNRSPERGRDLKSPSFFRSVLEDSGTVDNGLPGGMDTSSYVTRAPFRSRSPMNREANVFRARLGLRPTGETGHDRFVNVGRGRGRYGEDAPRGRYHGPAGDECDEFVTEYSHPFPRRRRCFSPIERRTNNNSYQSGSRSPSRPRTRSPNTGFRRRSRSPNFRPDSRIRPGYRDHGPEYKRSNNSSPPGSRWVNYKERERPVFDRRSSPPPGERFNFYDSSRKPKQNEYYRSGQPGPGRFSDMNEGGRGRPVDRPSNGYKRGGFVKRSIDGPTKRLYYDDEDGFGRGFDARDRHALEAHARSNPNPNPDPDPKDEVKPCSNGPDSRFRDFPRRVREEGDLKKRGKESIGDDFERKGKEMKDESVTTNVDLMVPNEGKEGDNNKPILGSN